MLTDAKRPKGEKRQAFASGGRSRAKSKKDNQITGNAGVYYCCYRLSLLGWNVMPTARNARGVDIIAYKQDASRFIAVQVKALSEREAAGIGPSLDKVMGDFWLIVNDVVTTPSVFVFLPQEVKELASRDQGGRAPPVLAAAESL